MNHVRALNLLADRRHSMMKHRHRLDDYSSNPTLSIASHKEQIDTGNEFVASPISKRSVISYGRRRKRLIEGHERIDGEREKKREETSVTESNNS